MLIETMAKDIILTDRTFALKLRRYLNENESSISGPVKKLWKESSEIVTVDETRKALETGKITKMWRDAWSKKIREFVRTTITTAWIKSITESGDAVAKKVNQIQVKQFDFDTTMTSVKAWVDSQGGKLIVDLTTAQMGSIQALLQDQIAFQVTSPYVLAQRIRPIVGLTKREAMAVARTIATLTEAGVPPATINSQASTYAKFLHKNRAARIARTELSNSFNFGHLDSLKHAASDGWLPGVPEKNWIAGGADPCEICEENAAAGFIALDATFPSGDEHPTAHPHCECSLGSRIRRA